MIPGSSGSRVLFWGNTYSGRGDPDVAIQAVVAACSSRGLTLRSRRDLDDGAVELEVEQAAPWREVWRRKLLQRAVWRIEEVDDELRVTSDFRMFPGYAVLVVGVAVLIGILFAASVVLDPRPPGGRGPFRATGLLPIPACLLAWWLAPRIAILGSHRADLVRREVVAALEGAGGALEPLGLDSGRRYVWAMCGYLAYFAALTAAWLLAGEVASPQIRSAGFGMLAFLAAALVSLVFLAAMLVAMIRTLGLGVRTTAIQTGLATSGCALLLTSAQVGCWYGLRLDLRAGSGLRMLSWTWLAMITIPAAFAIQAFVRYALFGSLHGASYLGWTREHRAWRQSRAAAGDPRMVRRFRRLLLPIWVSWGLVLLLGAIAASIALIGWAVPGLAPLWWHLMVTTGFLLSGVLGRAPGDLAITVASPALWSLYSALLLTLHALSLGQLGLSRRRTRRRLRASRPDPATDAGRRLIEVCAEMARAAGLAAVRPAVSDHPAIGAWSASFGLLGRERYVEVTTGAIRELSRAELAALVAHEMAHHVDRRPLLDARVRWLGRLTFTGDGFSRAVQHTFGYEEDADRIAATLLDRCGIDRQALRGVLVKIRHANPLLAAPGEAGLPVAPADAGAPEPAQRWLAALAAFLDQYTSGHRLHYWHPSHPERLAALAAAVGSAPPPGAAAGMAPAATELEGGAR